MRFVLADRSKRLSLAERFCFRGSIEPWIDIGDARQPLPVVVRKFIKHLGRQSLFDLH